MAIKLLYIDLFCGAGGTSTGVERAQIDGRKCAKVIACVNHDANAILSHAANHPHTRHFTEDIRTLDLGPMKVHVARERMKHPGAKLVLWASLECTNHSRAKGGMSRDANSRTLADHLFRYIEELRPDYIQIENVVEFMEWGPLIVKESVGPDGAAFCPLDIKHDRKRRTTTVAPVWVPAPEHKRIHYRRWVEEVCAHGYRFEHRVLNAADFGAYTSRVRYFGQFARPDLPMAWPRQTHARNPEQTRDLFTEPLAPWRPVRECLDFEDRGESIFDRRRQLVGATLDRIHAGLVKFVAGGKDAFLVKYNSRNQSGKYIAPGLDAPCPTVATQNRLGVARVDFLSKQFSGQPAGKNIPIDGPAGTVTTIDHHAFVSAYYGNGYNSPVERPAPTLTTKDRFQLVQPFITNYYSGGGQLSGVNEPTGALLTNPKQRIVNAHYLLNPQYRSAGGSVDAPCFTLIARMDKRPPYLVSIEQGVPAWTIKPDDIPEMVRVKEFCILYGIVDVTMRMLRIPEMKRIQGFGDDYVLIGSQEEQKKFLGNAVVTQVATAWSEATAAAIDEIKSPEKQHKKSNYENHNRKHRQNRYPERNSGPYLGGKNRLPKRPSKVEQQQAAIAVDMLVMVLALPYAMLDLEDGLKAAGKFRHEIKRRHRQAEEIVFSVTEPAYRVFARYSEELAWDYVERMENLYAYIREQVPGLEGADGAVELIEALCRLIETYNRRLEYVYYFNRAEPIYKIPRLLECIPARRRDIAEQIETALQNYNRERYGKS